MLSKRKLVDILLISFLLSLVIIISFFNLISEEQGRENFAGTVLYLILFAAADVIVFVWGDRAVSLFSFVYFVLVLLCFAFGFAMEIFDIGFGAISFFCALLISPFYGFMYVTEHWVAVAVISALVLCVLSALISFFTEKKHSAE